MQTLEAPLFNGFTTLIGRLALSATPFRLLVFGYMVVTISGALLLSLPVSTTGGRGQNFIDALFIAASGISTTGLVVVDIGSFYTIFGQIVLLCIFQIGGIGYMTIIIFLTQVIGKKTTILTQIVAKESLAGPNMRQLGSFFMATIAFTMVFELAGAVVLTIYWSREYPLGRAAYLGFFHSVSAFCTAGFGLLPDSLVKHQGSLVMNATINIVSLAGGLGFFVLYEFYSMVTRRIKNHSRRRLSVHSRLVLITTAALIAGGSAIILLTESWDPAMGICDRLLVSVFQSVSAQTTDGFNTVDIGKLGATSLTVLMILMFIGASPGSTGGGIKTTTFGAISRFLYCQLKGCEESVNLFGREIPSRSIGKAFSVLAWFGIIIVLDMLVMVRTERAGYLQVLFEIVSALGNTGLSTGITPDLSTVGRVILIITMFIGRVGPLTIGFFIIGRQHERHYHYAEEDIFIG